MRVFVARPDAPSISIQLKLFRHRHFVDPTYFSVNQKGVAVRGINVGDVRPLEAPLPSRSEQREIVFATAPSPLMAVAVREALLILQERA